MRPLQATHAKPGSAKNEIAAGYGCLIGLVLPEFEQGALPPESAPFGY